MMHVQFDMNFCTELQKKIIHTNDAGRWGQMERYASLIIISYAYTIFKPSFLLSVIENYKTGVHLTQDKYWCYVTVVASDCNKFSEWLNISAL